MAKLHYQVTKFKEPNPISEAVYMSIRQETVKNPNFQINDGLETFNEHFKDIYSGLKMLSITVAAGLALVGLFSNIAEVLTGIFGIIASLAFFVICFVAIAFLAEAPSYAIYLGKRKNYFKKMQSAIIKSSNYQDFYKTFYHY